MRSALVSESSDDAEIEKAIAESAKVHFNRFLGNLLRARREGNTHCDGELRVSLADDKIVSGAVTIAEKFKA